MADGIKAGTAFIDVDAKLDALNRTLDREVPKAAAAAGDKASKGISKGLGGLKQGLIGSFKNISGLDLGAGVTGIGLGLDALAAPAERAEAKLKATFRAAGHDTKDYEKELDSVRHRMENFGHTNADTNEALSKLTAAFQDPKKAMHEMGLAADIAGFKHISLASAAALVVKMHAGAGKVFKEFGINIKDAGASEKELEKASKANTTAASKLEKAKAAQALFETKLHLKKKITANDYLREIQLQHNTAKALDDYKKAHDRLALAQKNVHDKQGDIDKAMDDLGHRVKGQAGAAVSMFAGKFDVWKTKIQDVAAQWGAKLGPALTAAGPLLLGISTIMPGLAAGFGALISPVGLVVLGIVALAAGAIYAYTHFQTFRDIVDGVGRWFRDTLWPWLQQVAAGIVDTFNSMKGSLMMIWDGIKLYVQGVINIVRGIIQTVMALIHGDWGKAWDGIKLMLSGVWDAMKGIVFIGIGQILSVLKAMGHLAGNLWGWMENGLAGIWDRIVSTIGNGVNKAIDVINGLIHIANHIPGVHIDDLDHVHWGGGHIDAPVRQIGHGGSAGGGNIPLGPQRPVPGGPGGPAGPPTPVPGGPGGPAGPPDPHYSRSSGRNVNVTINNYGNHQTADQQAAAIKREERLAYAG